MTNEVEAKVTTAVLGVKIDYLTVAVEDAIDKMEDNSKRTNEVEKCIVGLKIEVDANSKRTQNWDIANSALGLALAGVLAYFGLRN
jgi:hypothetical protein